MKLTAEKDITDKIAAARERLVIDEPRPNGLAALSAAAFAAAAAVLMAGVVVAGPGVQIANPNAIYTR
nr:peptidoglycan-binding protein [uncultured Brevundimonas sp.]